MDKLIGNNWLCFSTIYTLFTAVFDSFVLKEGMYFSMVGVALIIAQLIIFSHQIHNKIPVIDEIKDYIYKHKTIRSHRTFDDLKTQIDTRINSNKVDHITIICYGTSGFDDLIHDLNSKPSSITVDILVCSPDSDYILYKEEDKPKIENIINICKYNSKITLIKSLIPPTIRACILYNKDKEPIWASIQTYYFEDNKDYSSFNYRKFYAVVADEENYQLLKEMKIVINDEFERLNKFSLKRQGLNDNQIKAVLHCCKKKKITQKEYQKITNCQNQKIAKTEIIELVKKNILHEIQGKYVLAKG